MLFAIFMSWLRDMGVAPSGIGESNTRPLYGLKPPNRARDALRERELLILPRLTGETRFFFVVVGTKFGFIMYLDTLLDLDLEAVIALRLRDFERERALLVDLRIAVMD